MEEQEQYQEQEQPLIQVAAYHFGVDTDVVEFLISPNITLNVPISPSDGMTTEAVVQLAWGQLALFLERLSDGEMGTYKVMLGEMRNSTTSVSTPK